MADEKVYIADKTTLDLISTNVGEYTDETSDKVGSLHNKLMWTNEQIGLPNDVVDTTTIYGKLNTSLSNISDVSDIVNAILKYLGEDADNPVHSKLDYIRDTLIGATNNSSGSSTAGTMMAKLNAIINYVDTVENNLSTISTDTSATKAATAVNNTASSTGTLSQKLTYIISTLIGATSETGGSNSAGTLMAKLNAIINYVDGVESTLSTVSTTASNAYTRADVAAANAGNANTNASNASSYANTAKTQIGSSNDTASQTGTSVQSKLKYVANTVASINTTVNNMVSTLSSISSSISNISSGGIRRIQSGVCSVRNSSGNINKAYSLTGFTNASKMIAFVIPVLGAVGNYNGNMSSSQSVAMTGPASLSTTLLNLRVEAFGNTIPSNGSTWIQGWYTVIEFN